MVLKKKGHGHHGHHSQEKKKAAVQLNPSFNNQSKNAVNLNVLKRHDETISDILGSTSHTVVYLFDNDSQSWAKFGIEGALFVFVRASPNEKYGLTVMNRLDTNNFTSDLTASAEIDILGDYIILRTPEEQVFGLWVYEPSDRQRLWELLQKCVSEAKQAPIKEHDENDIMRFFKQPVNGNPKSSKPVDLSVTSERLKQLLDIGTTPEKSSLFSLDHIFQQMDALPPAICGSNVRADLSDEEVIGRLVCLCQKDLEFRQSFIQAYKNACI